MKGWGIKAKPLPYLVAVKNGKEFGWAGWAEGRKWYCWLGDDEEKPTKCATVATKRMAIRWLLAFCPPGAGVNEISRQWERTPTSPRTQEVKS